MHDTYFRRGATPPPFPIPGILPPGAEGGPEVTPPNHATPQHAATQIPRRECECAVGVQWASLPAYLRAQALEQLQAGGVQLAPQRLELVGQHVLGEAKLTTSGVWEYNIRGAVGKGEGGEGIPSVPRVVWGAWGEGCSTCPTLVRLTDRG